MSPPHFCTAGTSRARRPGLQDRHLPATATALTRLLLRPGGINGDFSPLEVGEWRPAFSRVEAVWSRRKALGQTEGLTGLTDRLNQTCNDYLCAHKYARLSIGGKCHHLGCSLAVWLWASHLTSLSLRLHLYGRSLKRWVSGAEEHTPGTPAMGYLIPSFRKSTGEWRAGTSTLAPHPSSPFQLF